MNVGEARKALAAYPDDMELAVVSTCSGDLDTGTSLSVAINHPGSRPRGAQDWHWQDDPIDVPGTAVLVLY